MKKSKAYHEKKSRTRAQHKAEKRAKSRKSAPIATRQPSFQAGRRIPAMASKSNELILLRLEHQKDEKKRIAPRQERGMKVLAMNGRAIQQRRAVA